MAPRTPGYDPVAVAAEAVCRATEARVWADHVRTEATQLREQAAFVRRMLHALADGPKEDRDRPPRGS
ncbi:MAG TPA: hypothetical protein VKE40_12840 [Gemmataceae bacterium]|nr:hypothetical protein [Gemmataceae bacterium]